MKLFAVTYHFVCDPPSHLPGLQSITPERFQQQLDHLCAHYEPFFLDEPEKSIESNRDKFLLTFDHGTIDHLDVVLPELTKRNLKGYFYIITSVPEENKIPTPEKQRYVEAYFRDYREFYEQFYTACLEIDPHLKHAIEPSEKNLTDVRNYLKRFAFYSDLERLFRKVRNELLDREHFYSIFDNLFEKLFGSDASFINNNYLSWEQLKLLQNEGMVIGSHGHDQF